MTVERIPITDHASWIALRREDFTAHDAGALFGVHAYRTLYAVYHEKRGAEFTAVRETAWLRRGRELEPIIVQKLRDKFPDWKFRLPNEYLRNRQHRLGCTPDVYATDPNDLDVTVQLKTVSPYELKRHWTESTLPEWILLQNLTELMLTDAAYGWVVAFDIDKWEIREPYRVDRYPEVESEIAKRAEIFMAAVDAGIEPSVDFGRDAALLAARFNRPTPGKTVDLRADNRAPELCRAYLDYGEQIKELNEKRDAINAELTEKIGDAEIAQIVGFDVTRKTISRKGYFVKPTSYPKLNIVAEDETDAAS